jgi:hypothetical protein
MTPVQLFHDARRGESPEMVFRNSAGAGRRLSSVVGRRRTSGDAIHPKV